MALFLCHKNELTKAPNMYYTDQSIVFLDGRWLPAKDANVSLYSQTMHYGSGVFEGIRSYRTADSFNIFKAKDHFDRLIYSAQKMHMEVPYTTQELTNIAYELLDKNDLTDAYIRPLVFAGENMGLSPAADFHVFMTCWKWEKYLGSKPLNVMVSSYRRPDPRSCHVEAKVVGHYSNSLLATTEAKKLGYDEALLLDADGYVAEAPGANFFYEKDGMLYTPPAGNILPGITRSTVKDLAYELGIPVIEKKFEVEEVYKADSAFFVGTAVEVAGIESINGEKLPLIWEDSIGHQIYLMYRQKVMYNEYQGLTIV